MKIYDSCQASIDSCLFDKSFSIAWLYNDEKAMGIHTHDCYEVYFSISGGKQFLIDNSLYEFKPGDIFFINQLENHYLSKVEQVTHERIVIFIEPKYLESASTLPAACFVRKRKKAHPQLMVSQLRVGLGMLLPLFTQDTSLASVVISQEYTVTGLIGEKLPHDEFTHFQFDLEEREQQIGSAIVLKNHNLLKFRSL